MKAKLLFFLLTIFSFTSCVEYIDNGVVDFNPEPPEENVYIAEVANPEEAKYIGDTFVFKATLNDVDVTESTIFRVNGTQIVGNTYLPHRTGSNSVIAAMDDYEYTFRFNVLERDEEPEPEENRIEYEGNSYPVDETLWTLMLDGTNILTIDGEAVWILMSGKMDSSGEPQNQFVTIVTNPVNSSGQAVYPFAPDTTLSLMAGGLMLNGAEVFEEGSAVTFNFATTGNNVPDTQNIGHANYTSVLTGTSSKTAELFWNGNYTFNTLDINSIPGAKGSTNLYQSLAKYVIK